MQFNMTKSDKKHFMRFLKENGCYISFLNNCKKRIKQRKGTIFKLHNSSIHFFLKEHSMSGAIQSAFLWCETPEGHEFWEDIAKKISEHEK